MKSEHELITTSTESRQLTARSGRSKACTRLAVATAVAAIAAGGLIGGTAQAARVGEAIVECNGAYNTIDVTPRVVSDYANSDQWTASRVWLATWNGSSRTWTWGAQAWKVELASASNNPSGTDIARLDTQSITKGDGYYYVYVETYMWNGSNWYGASGDYTRSYTQVTPSVSHEPDTRTQATICAL